MLLFKKYISYPDFKIHNIEKVNIKESNIKKTKI